jgi:hypothetical protein
VFIDSKHETNTASSSTDGQYSIPSLRDDVFSKYISQHSLTHPLERAYFVLDDLLKGILLSKKEKEKDEEFMRRDEGLKRLVAACQPWYKITADGRRTELRYVLPASSELQKLWSSRY